MNETVIVDTMIYKIVDITISQNEDNITSYKLVLEDEYGKYVDYEEEGMYLAMLNQDNIGAYRIRIDSYPEEGTHKLTLYKK
jgi:hypothetical protein